MLIGIVRVFLRMRQGEFDEQELEQQLNSRGFMNRFLGRATRAVKKPWHMYPLGLLFGLGFDTATEIALLATAGTAAAGGLPITAILCLPILFAAGMSLLDTIDGAFMNFAYGWAFSKPVRKIFYNITVTALSVAVALIIGTVELLAVFADKFSLNGGIWDFVSNLDLNIVGYFIVGAVRRHLAARRGRLALRAHRGTLVRLDRASRAARRSSSCREPGQVTRRSACRVTRMGEPSIPLSQCWVAYTRCVPRAKPGMRQRTAKRPCPSSTARANTTSFTASTTRGLQNSI